MHWSKCVLLALAAGCSLPDRAPLPDWDIGNEDTDPVPPDTDVEDTGETDVPDTDTGVEDTDWVNDTAVDTGAFSLAIPTDLLYPMRVRKMSPTTHQPLNEACEVPLGAVGEDADIECVVDVNELDVVALGLGIGAYAPEGMCEYFVHQHYIYESWEVGLGPEFVSFTVNDDGSVTDEVNSLNGQPICDYDYTDSYPSHMDPPNCCLGNYEMTVTYEDGNVEVSHGQWGGDALDCYSGAGFLDLDAIFTDDGWPARVYTYVGEEEYWQPFQFDTSFDKYLTSVPFANWYTPGQHDGTMPGPLAGVYAQPYYEVACADHAEEYAARIRYYVREWNEEAEFLIDGDPNTSGTEDDVSGPLDDWSDWAVLGPGDDVFPMGQD